MWFFGSSCIQGSLTAYWWISCWMILFCFTPPVPTIASLEINSLGAAFGASADANFPFKTPLNIRALDAGGEVITDGPDSILVRRQWGIVDWQSKHLCKRILYGCLTSCFFFFLLLFISFFLLSSTSSSLLRKSQWRQILPQPVFPMTALSSLFMVRQCSQDPSAHPFRMCSSGSQSSVMEESLLTHNGHPTSL